MMHTAMHEGTPVHVALVRCAPKAYSCAVTLCNARSQTSLHGLRHDFWGVHHVLSAASDAIQT